MPWHGDGTRNVERCCKVQHRPGVSCTPVVLGFATPFLQRVARAGTVRACSRGAQRCPAAADRDLCLLPQPRPASCRASLAMLPSKPNARSRAAG